MDWKSGNPNVKMRELAEQGVRGFRVDLVALIKRLHEAFGPKRLMWASDCPFQTVGETYEDSISLVRDRLDFVTAEDKEWMLRRTAEESFFQ